MVKYFLGFSSFAVRVMSFKDVNGIGIYRTLFPAADLHLTEIGLWMEWNTPA
jgi:hypothetical protein